MLPPGRNLTVLAGVWMTPPRWLVPLVALPPLPPLHLTSQTGRADWDSASPGAQGQRRSAAIDSPAQSRTAGGIAARAPQVTAPCGAVRCSAVRATIHFSFAV
jgi:hypothetical protein